MSTSRRAGVLVGGLSLIVGGLAAVTLSPAAAVPGAASTVFINEIHYDNAGTDAGEFVEVAAPEGTDLTGWTLELYNLTGGARYATLTLPPAPTNPSNGYGFVSVDAVGIQNGERDGIALVDAAGNLVQFLSYEGTLTAMNGTAAGETSTDVGVDEEPAPAAGMSLQLTDTVNGAGSTYGDFAWTGPTDDSPGAVNSGQTFTGGGGPAQPVADCGDGSLVVDSDASGSRDVSATDTDSRIVSAEITSADVEGITLDGFTASGDEATATLKVADTTADGSYEVEIDFTTDDDPAQTATCTVTVEVRDLDAITLISDIQGDGSVSPLAGDRVNVEAVVTSLITANDALDGFFLQEEDVDTDADENTSEGVYVLCETACPDVAAGDRVRVSGVVEEFFNNTQIDASGAGSRFETRASGQPLPAAAAAQLPADASTKAPATFEDVEGMRTTISTTMAVSEYFSQARFGQIILTADERAYQFTQTNEPSEAGYSAHLADLAKRQIILDDDSNSQNPATSGPEDNEPYFYPTPGLSTGHFFRGGDTIEDLTGVFEYAFGAWQIRPVTGADYTFDATNPRPASPTVGGTLKVASFNVLNYFATIGQTCGPDGNEECRGANSEAERVRQLDKIVAALADIDADVFGLIEIENDEGEATQQIVDALNAQTAAGTFDYIDTGFTGTDVIRQAFIYNTTTVSPVGDFDLLTSADDPRFDDGRNRPALIQTFEEDANGERVTVAVNHLKSKGSPCGAGDDSPADGSGNCDGTRTDAANALKDYLATDPTGSGDDDSLIIGDLNSYAMERPIAALVDAGYTDLLQKFEGPDAYTYLFDGQLGTLDFGLANTSLVKQVTGASGWTINADENPLFDYNDTVRDNGEASFDRKSTAEPLYEPTPFRASDHDPVIIGLALGEDVTETRDKVEMDIELKPRKVEAGKTRPRLEVEVEDEDNRRQSVSGVVRVSYEDEVRTETLRKGEARFDLGTFDTPGTVTVTVEYLGSATHRPYTETFTLEVYEKKRDNDDD